VIDTTGGPGFGFLQYKQFDFLTDKEVVLTFDDGPWPTTPAC
jgi:peptidoglycan/xylan/chitin deacetylase (PgdA/CDA1 family)